MTLRNSHDVEMSTNEMYKRAVSKGKYVLPFYIFVPVLFVVLFNAFGQTMNWKAFGLGALGWFVALVLRGPIGAIAIKKTTKEKANNIVVSASGPLEEGVRFVLLALTASSLPWSLSIGQGWAAIEVLFTIINGIVLITLANRTDEEAMQAKEMLKMQGNLTSSPVWGIIERLFASSYHIGATLILAAAPWAVILLIPFHSFFNIYSVKLSKKSVAITEALVGAVGIIILTIGLLII
ncbi:YhfC family glutamic-type intramembrane protease [Neobacillus niacini]|uniref:YhfC family glutamic-type intramembrane protease n=1 Tax=Neobacillus niacini TaxID=86668 RepID=UPI002866AB7B|nr:YhfC family glutamic-type intramembrane protease [Neobacillus niacini]MDR7002735.1 hypothetical protein [Neobacillus niacini]